MANRKGDKLLFLTIVLVHDTPGDLFGYLKKVACPLFYFYEDFVVGRQTVTPERKITVNHLDAFLNISGLHLPMFLSDESAQRIGHEKRLLPGPMILSVAMGLAKETGWFDHVVAVLEFDELRFRKALHPRQSIKPEITVKHTKRTQNPERGLVTLAYKVTNENDEVVLTGKGKYLMQACHPG